MPSASFPAPFNQRRRRWLLAGVLAPVLLLGLAAYALHDRLHGPLAVTGEPVVFMVEPGSSLGRVTGELAAMGLLDSPAPLTWYARLRGVAGSIQSGEYTLTEGITPLELLDKMITGDTVQYRLTLVEGWTLARALDEIGRSPNIQRQLDGSDPRAVAGQLGLDYPSAEGLFYPDTYFYSRGASDRELLLRAHDRLRKMLAEAWTRRLGALPYATPYEALILASIIEKESAAGSERGHIAGVFVRRLEQGMRLQSDPTVIYGMGDDYTGNITRGDLLRETPYNTYRINGLPPTPIGLAGMESIQAAMQPLFSDYLYFVSRGDGTHYFSSTLEEHNAAVRRFQLQQQNQDQNQDQAR